MIVSNPATRCTGHVETEVTGADEVDGKAEDDDETDDEADEEEALNDK